MYDYKVGLGKGLKFTLTALGAIAIFTNFSNVSLWDLMVKYVQPLLGTLTIGALITMALNVVKAKFGGFKEFGKAVFK